MTEKSLVSTEWLANEIKKSNAKLKILHVSWKNGEDYKKCHIPQALCFDGLNCRNTESPYMNMIPKPDKFASFVSKLGISNDTHVILYDISETIPSLEKAARVWFLFRVFGHDLVSVLNGGLNRWLKEKRSIEEGIPKQLPKAAIFKPKYRAHMVKSYKEIRQNQKTQTFQLIDGRDMESFDSDNEGHIIGAISVPITDFLDSDTLLMLTPQKLRKRFEESGLDLNKTKAVASCKTGVMGCALVFAAFRCGDHIPLYDGSYFEFSRRAPKDCIRKGPPPNRMTRNRLLTV